MNILEEAPNCKIISKITEKSINRFVHSFSDYFEAKTNCRGGGGGAFPYTGWPSIFTLQLKEQRVGNMQLDIEMVRKVNCSSN